MKKIIEYYYSFKNIELDNIGREYSFSYNNKKYLFFACRRSVEELYSISKLLQNSDLYNKIVPNIFNQLVTTVEGKNYILVEKRNGFNSEKIELKDILLNYKIIDTKEYGSLLRINWYELWTKKIDYILYQREHIKGKYVIIDEYLDYYVGMAENAISYYKNTIDSFKNDSKDLYVLSHRRINSFFKSSYYNVDDLIIDYSVRNISEYLKTLFYKDSIEIDRLNSIMSVLNYNEFLYRLFFSRMIFPSAFFDIYERVVNDDVSEDELLPIINKTKEYESLLKNIFFLINKKNRIPQVDWLS
jgi:hypothetical protein